MRLDVLIEGHLGGVLDLTTHDAPSFRYLDDYLRRQQPTPTPLYADPAGSTLRRHRHNGAERTASLGPAQTSSIKVTGPSLVNSTAIWAPKTPVATVAPRRRSSATSSSIRRAATSGAAAATNDGLRPLRVSP